ncbi:TIGR03086 family metal-binding protein [Embleya sp. NPDC127516]|uniref:TIGR03086 family metal-binding protein n=1 Tax=Embleya sp. NPDC127516 TaxID=3363990 RepID=UPI0037FA427D
MTLDLQSPAATIARLADGIEDERLDDPTPCTHYRIRDLLSHLVGLTAAFRDAARKEFGPSTQTAPGGTMPALDPRWRDLLSRQLPEMVDAWRKPDAWEGETQAGGVTLPAEIMGLVAHNELVLHGWDLARALGRDYTVDTANLEASLAFLTPPPDADHSVDAPVDAQGLFARAVPLPADAPLLDRVVAMAGRAPNWPAAE